MITLSVHLQSTKPTQEDPHLPMSDDKSKGNGLDSNLFNLDLFSIDDPDMYDEAPETASQENASFPAPDMDAEESEAENSSFSDMIGATYFRDDFKQPEKIKAAPEPEEVAIEDDRIIPKVSVSTYKEKPLVVVIDDDFTVLDIMKIYLAREYTYMGFTNPKDAIFYMNANVPSLVFLDSYMSMISTKKLLPIIKSYEYMKNVPIYYICEESEKAAVKKKLSDDIQGIITRPVARGDLQKILDSVFAKQEQG